MTLLFIAFGTLISEDLACISAGLLVAGGAPGFWPATLACFLGIFIGDVLLYLAGRWLGRPVIRWLVSAAALQRGANWFQRKGPRVLLLSRFVPGSRLPTYLAAGILRSHFGTFAACLALAGIIWTPLLVGASAWIGDRARAVFKLYERNALAVGLTLWLILKWVLPLWSWRGRRLLLSRWRRLTRWEFWPLWAFYPPVVLYILWLALKHRSLALFTAANPAIPAGGIVGESKSDILRQLPEEFVARYELVDSPPAAYPVVLKPDAGQRGLGVAVVHTRQEAAEYFRVNRGATIAQEYVPGEEFGVFYYRYPNETRGHIYSITEKRFPAVTGDGASTLEELILRDDRAVCMARFFLKKHADKLDHVPAAGEVVPLAELGTHCRGSVFRDGGWVKTPELEAAIDRISRGFTGFFVGRYDIRTPSVAEFRQGRNFKIVELNGVTSEATHIYQPGASLLAGYRTLMRQWRITFEIAAQNRARGITPVPVRQLLDLLVAYRPAVEV
jgi:membrane protein DedA with SNARE-associated domain